MQKRLLRYSTPEQIRQHLPGLAGKKINIVLTDDTVMFAEVLKSSENELLVQNMRRQELTVAFSDIYEIIIDINA